MEDKKYCTAVVLAAGSGKRMGSQIPKQFMPLKGKPVLWYSLQAMEQSPLMDEVVLVTGEDDIPRVRTQFVEQYSFQKIKDIVAGGAERYESVYHALLSIKERNGEKDGYVFIHDGARPFVSQEILKSLYLSVQETQACVTGTKVKDTIKVSNEAGIVVATPDRNTLWAVQTPQVFSQKLIIEAYERLMQALPSLAEKGITVTDDAMVVETMCSQPVTLVEGSYRNIKLTTPEDMLFAESLLSENPV